MAFMSAMFVWRVFTVIVLQLVRLVAQRLGTQTLIVEVTYGASSACWKTAQCAHVCTLCLWVTYREEGFGNTLNRDNFPGGAKATGHLRLSLGRTRHYWTSVLDWVKVEQPALICTMFLVVSWLSIRTPPDFIRNPDDCVHKNQIVLRYEAGYDSHLHVVPAGNLQASAWRAKKSHDNSTKPEIRKKKLGYTLIAMLSGIWDATK